MRQLTMVMALLLIASLMTACGKETQQLAVSGKDGHDGFTTYLTTKAIPPMDVSKSLCGLAGGIQLIPYTDYNRNGQYDAGEETVLASTIICNGAQGVQGIAGAIGAQGIQGATGLMGPIGPQGVQGIAGIKGAQGIAGPQGLQGLQGIQGIPGLPGSIGAQGPKGEPGIQGIAGSSNGSGLTPVKLCAADTSQYPEYGFIVGSSLYAVYYGVVNGTLNAFMARLTPGNYVSTNSTNCKFTYSIDHSGNQYLDNTQITQVTNRVNEAD